eukprot:MONOS_1875.1-p1 / transcript=MONOS_1875.1 / gene=MONOS_1875 / organism=Monocercomonoides_exilis_PA203 / gene_product=unspecified product / transcript_product=unspecified product / location=Mono_scaffold00035:174443-179634(-) / protein_length=1490 / sequence_SO=supercontig / SO=protein_coding / is_pseudo=false
MARSRAVPSRSGAVGILPMRKTKRERPRGRSLSRSSESESESDDTEMIAKKRHRQRLRGSRGRNQMKKWDDVETSESDSENTEKREEEQDRSEDFLGIFPDECWNALAVTGVTAEGRKDSPEAARVIELLQPALESGLEAAKAIAALTTRELKKTRLEEEEKERLRGLFCAYALIADCISRINLLKVIPQSSWENVKCFLDGGMSKDIPESFRRLVDSTSFFRPGGDAPGYGASPVSSTTFGLAPVRGGRSGRYSTGRNAQEKKVNTSSTTTGPSYSWESALVHSPPSSSSPEDTGRISNRNSNWIEPMGLEETEREERTVLCRETEIDRKLFIPERVTTQQVFPFNRQTITEAEPVKACENSEEALSPSDQKKRIEIDSSIDCEMGTGRENTEEDSVYPHGTVQMNDQELEREVVKRALRASGTVIESLIGSVLEESWKIATADTLEGKETAQIQTGLRTPEVGSCVAVGLPKEPLPGRLVNRLSEWRKIGGDKLVSRGVSGYDKNDEQLFIPHGGGIEGRSGEARAGVGGEVVQPDIHGNKQERKVEEDSGLQNFKRGSARETLQDGFPGDSCGTPGGERLDDYARHIECLSTCQSGRAVQSLSVLQLPKAMLHLRGDAIWSKGRAQSIHEDNETGSVIYQRTLEGKAGDISGRHPPHAPRQGCFEIDLTGDSPVPEKSGLDTVGGEAEARTRKERGVFGMELELREDGRDAPRKEESAAPGGCAKVDSTCKEEENTKDEGFSSTPREVKFREVTAPTSKLVDETHAIHTEAGNSPRRLERDSDTQPNDVRRINTLEENSAREQTKESEEKEQTSRADNGCVRAGMGCSINNTNREQRGEDICPRELDPPGERISDKREGVQSSVEDFGKERSMAERTEDRSYSSEDRQHVHEMDNPEEKGSTIAHSNTESIGEETEQPGHYDTNGTSPGRTEHGSRCTQPDGEKAGRRTERGGGGVAEILQTIAPRTLDTISEQIAPVPCGSTWRLSSMRRKREKGTPEDDIVLVHPLAGADLDPATAAWVFDKDPGDLSGVHDTGNEDEKGRLEITPRRGNKRYTGEENIQGRDLFLTWGEHVGAKDIAAAILRNQKSERDTWRALRRFKQFLDRESMDDTDPLTTKDAKWIMAEFIETLSNTNLSSGVINQTVRKVLDSINLFRKTKVDVKDIEIFLKTYVGEKPRRGNRSKSMWDLTIITKWAEATHDMKDPQTLQRRALILTMIFGALRPAELERMRRGTTIFKENLVQTQVQTKTSGGETVKVIINKHPNPRIDAVVVLQRWMDYTKTTLRDEPRQQAADWKAINAYARWAPGSRVAQEYYTVLPVQDTRWILETIGGPVPLAEKGGKSEKDSKEKEISVENTESETKELPEETSQSGGEAETSERRNSKRRGPTREKSSHHEDDITQPTRCDETPSIIPRSIMELAKGRQPALQKKLETDRRKREERSIGQIIMPAQNAVRQVLLRKNTNADGETQSGWVRDERETQSDE